MPKRRSTPTVALGSAKPTTGWSWGGSIATSIGKTFSSGRTNAVERGSMKPGCLSCTRSRSSSSGLVGATMLSTRIG